MQDDTPYSAVCNMSAYQNAISDRNFNNDVSSTKVIQRRKGSEHDHESPSVGTNLQEGGDDANTVPRDNKITNYMEQSHSLHTNTSSACQDIPRITVFTIVEHLCTS